MGRGTLAPRGTGQAGTESRSGQCLGRSGRGGAGREVLGKEGKEAAGLNEDRDGERMGMVSRVSLSVVPSPVPHCRLGPSHLVPRPMPRPQEAPPVSTWWPSAEVLGMGGDEGAG